MNVTDLIGDNALPISHGKKQLWLNAKVCGGNCSLDAKRGFPHAPSRESSGRIKKQFFSLYFFRGKNADV